MVIRTARRALPFDHQGNIASVKYIAWAIIGGFSLWVLYIVAGLGSEWVSVGIVGFVGLIAVINRATRRPAGRTGQPSTQRRVISTDQDRWGGGGNL